MSKMKVNRIENTSTTAGGIDINTSGNVGIGEDDPTQLLVLKSAAPRMRLIDSDVSTGGQVSGSSGNLSLTYDVLGVGGKNFSISDSTSTRLLIDSSGNVGINTSSVSSSRKVEIVQPASYNSALRIKAESNGNDANIEWFTGLSQFAIGVTQGTDALKFERDGSEKMRIDSAGRVGIGTTSPTHQLTVHNASTTAGTIEANRFSVRDNYGNASGLGNGIISPAANTLAFATNSTERMRITGTGSLQVKANTGIDTVYLATPTAAGFAVVLLRGSHSASSGYTGTDCFYVFANGNVQNTNNSYGAISDVKLKENITDANSQWSDLKALQVRNFNFKEETGNPTHTQIGVIAQEAEAVSPGLVYETTDRDEDGNDLGTVTKSVNYSVLYMKAVKALQEAQTRIETLEQRLSDAGIA